MVGRDWNTLIYTRFVGKLVVLRALSCSPHVFRPKAKAPSTAWASSPWLLRHATRQTDRQTAALSREPLTLKSTAASCCIIPHLPQPPPSLPLARPPVPQTARTETSPTTYMTTNRGSVYRHIEASLPDVTLSADRFLVACGTRPLRRPDVPFDGVRIFDSDQLLWGGVKIVPRDLIVVGAGVIGMEYASM